MVSRLSTRFADRQDSGDSFLNYNNHPDDVIQLIVIQLLYFLIFFMKNSLELEITTLIKKANSLCAKQKLLQSLCLLDEALVAFVENKNYNHSVNPLLQGLLYSLKGLLNVKLNQVEKAEKNFDQSLHINPFDSLTLIRRGTLYCQTKRLPEALEDLERALICDPSGQSLKDLINSIQKSLQSFDNVEQKQRLQNNFTTMLKFISTQEEDEEIDEEKILNFSNLKKIDRQSFSNSSNKFCSFQSQFEDEKIERISEKFASEQTWNYQEQNNLTPVQIIQKSRTKKKPSPLSFNNLRFVSLCEAQKTGIKKLMSCQESYKSIEGLLERRSSVRFIQNPNTVFCSERGNEKKNQQIQQSPLKRKSCLRTSTLKQNECLPILLSRKSSSFMEIKNIDGNIILSSFSNTNQHASHRDNEVNNQISKQFSDSDEEANGEHDIFGQKSRTSKILQCLQNLNNWSGKKIQNKHEKKRSILKKNSLIGSEQETPQIRSPQHKKSVCFQDCESPKNK